MNFSSLQLALERREPRLRVQPVMGSEHNAFRGCFPVLMSFELS
jgi:hypothetical protein